MFDNHILIVCCIMILLGVVWGFSLIQVLSGRETQKGLNNFGLLAVLVGGILFCINFLVNIGYQEDKIYPVFFLLLSAVTSTKILFLLKGVEKYPSTKQFQLSEMPK